MTRIGAFTPEQLQRVWDATLASERQGGFVKPEERSFLEAEPIHFLNASGHTIPPFGICVAQSCIDVPSSYNYVEVVRPFTFFNTLSVVLVNGSREVPNDEYGTAQAGPVYRVVHDAAITYEVGDRLGWKINSFLAQLGALFRIIGFDDVAENCCRVVFDQSVASMQSEGTITAGAFGTAYLRRPTSGTWSTDTTKTYTVFNDTTTNIADDRRLIGLPTDGRFLVVEVC